MRTDGIDIHADDFGESVHASADILDCIRAGKLDSISVLCNMSCFEECVGLYRAMPVEQTASVKISVHINLMEGSSLTEPGSLPDLTDRQGHFCCSWGKLFVHSFLPGQKKWKAQLKREIRAQIGAVRAAFLRMGALRIDSHQHTHMIPLVAKALFEVLEEEGWETEYIRDAAEPLFVFLRRPSLYKTYRPVNFLKNLVLNFCSRLLQRRFDKYGFAPMCLWGLIMSGEMDEKRVRLLLPDMRRFAQRHGKRLEILFHPGSVLLEEIGEEFSQAEAVAFHVSPKREIEKQTVCAL